MVKICFKARASLLGRREIDSKRNLKTFASSLMID